MAARLCGFESRLGHHKNLRQLAESDDLSDCLFSWLISFLPQSCPKFVPYSSWSASDKATAPILIASSTCPHIYTVSLSIPGAVASFTPSASSALWGNLRTPFPLPPQKNSQTLPCRNPGKIRDWSSLGGGLIRTLTSRRMSEIFCNKVGEILQGVTTMEPIKTDSYKIKPSVVRSKKSCRQLGAGLAGGAYAWGGGDGR